MSLSQNQLRALLHYEPSAGAFVWLARASSAVHPGELAGSVDDEGYLGIQIRGKRYRATHLAWLYMTGVYPDFEVDHKNGRIDDNRWENLRQATRALNSQNQRRAHKRNSCGFLGVSRTADGSFGARIMVNKKLLWLGTYSTGEEAHAVYLKAKRELHEGCTI